MKKIIRKGLQKIFDPLAVRLGYDSIKTKKKISTKNSLLDNFYSVLKNLQFNPRHIVDVGANHGSWTREALVFFPDAYYTLLEPQYWMEDSVKDLIVANPKIKFHAVGAGAAPGTFKFTLVDRDDSCSFRYTEEDARKEGLKQIDIPVVTLNQLLSGSDRPLPDLIKIDAEGLDIEVLNGASDYFGKTEIFMVEAAVVNKEFNNNIQKLINYMDEKGYNLFDITDLNRPFQPPVLWLVELVFVRKGGLIDSKKII